MAKKKVEHVVFDGMRKVRKKINISGFNRNTVILNIQELYQVFREAGRVRYYLNDNGKIVWEKVSDSTLSVMYSIYSS